MKMIGVEGMTVDQVQQEINLGGKFVVYQFCISILVMTFKRSSDIYFVRHHENRVGKGMKFTILSFLLGWWGIPWGPIYTIGALTRNFKGGQDVTDEVMASITGSSEMAG
ncbi:hypothetical protein [Gorillibacterium sp. sgz500922]|uniref:hypothetical protein n=1 Tax=Gorillibacterium sp. sgz500922 TaxID=3446694 RepID=UPI003F66CB91